MMLMAISLTQHSETSATSNILIKWCDLELIMGGAVSVLGNNAAGCEQSIIDFEGVKSLLGVAWSEDVEVKLNSFNVNKKETEVNTLNTVEVQELLEWFQQRDIISKEMREELQNSLTVSPTPPGTLKNIVELI